MLKNKFNIKYKSCKKTHNNGSLDAWKQVSDVITALSPTDVDPLWASHTFSLFVHKLKTADTQDQTPLFEKLIQIENHGYLKFAVG
jgi:hypothetical protein